MWGKVREHGRITLNREGDGSWLLGVRYSLQKVSLPPSPDPDNVRVYAILAMLVGEIMYFAVKRFLPSRMLSFALLSIWLGQPRSTTFSRAKSCAISKASNIASWLDALAKFVIRLNEASFDLMLTLHGQMTSLLARAYIHISSFAAMQLLVGNPSLLLFSRSQLPKLN
jgi:xanthosine utilization system XapX-like protein